MLLSKILPRPLILQPASHIADTSTLLFSLIMSAHLDRAIGRRLGWRGVKPAGETAITCRVNGSACVYGVAFARESANPDLHGIFNIYAFPPADSPLLDFFPLSAMGVALTPEYNLLIRNFENNLDILAPFITGTLLLAAPLSGASLALQLQTFHRIKVISKTGVRRDESSAWVIKPGEPDACIPAFHILRPFFTTLVKTAENVLDEAPLITIQTQKIPGLVLNSDGTLVSDGESRLTKIHLTAKFAWPDFVCSISPEASQEMALKNIYPQDIETSEDNKPVLHILTGFLGSGKTTFLKQWLEFLHGRERFTGVIQNEYGPIDLDSALLHGDTVVEALDDGCVCCTISENLRPGISRILEKLPVHQFILETTGIANPANIMDEFQNITDLVQPGLIICIADADTLQKNGLPKSGTALDQLRFANVIILNKLDLAGAEGRQEEIFQELARKLAPLNPDAVILPAEHGAISYAMLDSVFNSLPQNFGKNFSLRHMAENFEKYAVSFSEPISLTSLEQLITKAGNEVLRIKGIIEIENKGPCIIQYVPGKLDIIPAPGLDVSGLSVIGMGLNQNLDLPCKISGGNA